MKISMSDVVIVASALQFANAVQSAWEQCGGIGWAGGTSCTPGYLCQPHNAYYSQCIPGSTKSSLSTSYTSSTRLSTTTFTSTKASSTTTSSHDASTALPSSSSVEYLITFGDSYSQTGFDPNLSTPSLSNPLGNPNFPGWTTSGGPNWIGYYITQFNSSPVYSYNFASGGATTDSDLVEPFASTVLSFVDQVDLYLENARKPGFVKWDAANSLFAVWIGVNDVGNAWYRSDYPALVGRIMDQYINQAQKLYDSGARRFVFLTVPPIQLSPAVQAQGDATITAEAVAIKQYNDALEASIAAFATANSNVIVHVVDTTAPFMEAIQNPKAYGADNASCFDASGTKCLWWNDYHPSMAIHELVAEAISEV
ncbi:hypothetical protein Q7P37_011118 [Cladosporium fusiforme]